MSIKSEVKSIKSKGRNLQWKNTLGLDWVFTPVINHHTNPKYLFFFNHRFPIRPAHKEKSYNFLKYFFI